MFSKFMETELEEIPSSPPGPCVSESSNVSILRNIFLVQNLQCPKFPLSPVPWGWTSSVRWMASPDLKEDGEQQQSKQEACRGWYCVGGKLHNTLSKSKLSFKQLAAAQTHQPQRAPTARRCPSCRDKGLMQSSSSLQAPRSNSSGRKQSCHRWVPGDEATPGKHTETLPPSALLTSDYFYPSGFPKPSIVSVIHQPSVKLFQLLILSPLKAVHFLQPSPAIPKVYYQVSEQF